MPCGVEQIASHHVGSDQHGTNCCQEKFAVLLLPLMQRGIPPSKGIGFHESIVVVGSSGGGVIVIVIVGRGRSAAKAVSRMQRWWPGLGKGCIQRLGPRGNAVAQTIPRGTGGINGSSTINPRIGRVGTSTGSKRRFHGLVVGLLW